LSSSDGGTPSRSGKLRGLKKNDSASSPWPRGRCPRCAGELIPVSYRDVELDKCSGCQGVWLDFGELDQVVAEDTGFLGAVRRIFT
jgi:hypothetical protein